MSDRYPWSIAPFALDILHADGYDLTGCGLLDRKRILAEKLKPSESVKLVDYFCDKGEILYQVCRERGFEGIVCKRAASTYRWGVRSHDWLKVKYTRNDNFVIVGYQEENGCLVSPCENPHALRIAGAVQFGFSQGDYDF